MGGMTNKLTKLALRNAKPGATTKRLADRGGLFLEVRPNGSKYWRMAYRYGGKQKLLALGVYPNVSIAKARKSAQQAKEQLAEGVDPGLVRKIRKGTNATDNTFQTVAEE
ncbi:Arm DNA-binding domain-containing protein [Desulfobulbus propionicus]|jgi:hypothetical protein|uniref:Arm DNA-binding domain-containing protein n=1 Tax=Desulfobulbus propionicus TaxID=894 RepID=UPI00030EE38F|nr:Arm DNA-binding domain-containing protein [Desulfobulbus propionicus]